MPAVGRDLSELLLALPLSLQGPYLGPENSAFAVYVKLLNFHGGQAHPSDSP